MDTLARVRKARNAPRPSLTPGYRKVAGINPLRFLLVGRNKAGEGNSEINAAGGEARLKATPRTPRVIVIRTAAALLCLAALPRVGALLTLPYVVRYADMRFGETVRLQKPIGDTNVGYGEWLDKRVNLYPLTEDERTYAELAVNALAGKGFAMNHGWYIVPPGKPTSYWNCCYPLLITASFAIFGVHGWPIWLFQIALGATSCYVIWLMGRRLLGPRVGGIAFGFASLYPPYVLNSIWMMTEALMVPLVVLWLYFFYEGLRSGRLRDFVAAGVAFGLAALTRSTVFYYLPGAVLLGAVALGRDGRRRAFAMALVFPLTVAAVIAPWTIRNWRVHRSFMLIDTKVGVNLWMFNNPNQKLGYRVQDGEMPTLTFPPGATEVEMDRAYFKLGCDYITSDVPRFLKVCGLKALLALNPVPKQAHSPAVALLGLVTAGWFLGLTPWGIYRTRRRWRVLLPLYGFMVYWVLIQAGSAAGMRYRMPADVVWVLFAAAGGAAVFEACAGAASKLRRGYSSVIRRGGYVPCPPLAGDAPAERRL